MWGGRFAEGPSALMREINASIAFDKRMWRQDLRGSQAHVAMLGKQGIVVARRTIAKYREELKIPTSNQRKVLY